MDRFTKFTIGVILLLIALIFIFIYLGSLKKNHIREIEITGGFESAGFSNPKIDIKFSRPLKRENIKDYISFIPEVEFNVNFIQNDLQITFPSGISAGEQYQLILKKEMKDIFDEDLDKEIVWRFKTRDEKVLFIKKGLESQRDKIIQSDKFFNNQEVLFESDRIKGYKKDNNYLLVVIINKDNTENIILKDLKEGSIKDFKLDKQSIFSADLKGNYVVFVAQKVEPKGRFLAPQGTSTINLLNIETGDLKLFNPKNTGVNSLFAVFFPDGKSILYKSQDSFYYISDVKEVFDPIGIGRFKTAGGFNKNLDRIIFTEFDPLQTYSSFPFITIFTSNREVQSITNGDQYVQDPKFFNKADSIIFSENFKDMEMTTGLFKIVKFEDGQFQELLKDEFNSYELPELNYNDKFLMAERYSPEDLLDFENQRSFIDYRKPLYGDLVMYDIENKKILATCENCIEGEFSK